MPEAVIGLLAAASLGAIWSSCSPDFGASSVIDRFTQIEPAVLITCDGYRYADRDFDRTALAQDVVAALPGLTAVIEVRLLAGTEQAGAAQPPGPARLDWAALGVGDQAG